MYSSYSRAKPVCLLLSRAGLPGKRHPTTLETPSHHVGKLHPSTAHVSGAHRHPQGSFLRAATVGNTPAPDFGRGLYSSHLPYKPVAICTVYPPVQTRSRISARRRLSWARDRHRQSRGLTLCPKPTRPEAQDLPTPAPSAVLCPVLGSPVQER